MAYLVRTGRLIFRLWCLFAIDGKWQGDAVMKRVGVVMAMLVLAGCGGGAGGWSKAGISPETAEADFADCQSQARAATRRDDAIDADIMASRGQDWQRAGTLSIKRDDMAMSTRGWAEQIIGRCMAAKGYAPAR
jgi:hypothetical protein